MNFVDWMYNLDKKGWDEAIEEIRQIETAWGDMDLFHSYDWDCYYEKGRNSEVVEYLINANEKQLYNLIHNEAFNLLTYKQVLEYCNDIGYKPSQRKKQKIRYKMEELKKIYQKGIDKVTT